MSKQDIKEWAIILTIIAVGIIGFCWSSQPRVRVIDGCEYIVTINAYGSELTHKGNCKNHEKVTP